MYENGNFSIRYGTFSKALQVFPLTSHWHLWYGLVDVNAHFKCDTIRTSDWIEGKKKIKITQIMTEKYFFSDDQSVDACTHGKKEEFLMISFTLEIFLLRLANSNSICLFYRSFAFNLIWLNHIIHDDENVLSVNYPFRRISFGFEFRVVIAVHLKFHESKTVFIAFDFPQTIEF